MESGNYKEKIEEIITQISSGLYGKDNSIRLVLLSFLAGESAFLLGEPGTAKSLIARRVSEAFASPTSEEEKKGVIKFFDYLMSRFSQPDEIFGPVSIDKLKEDKYERKIEHYLPKAQFAFLDEIWKANPAIQNALLTILNEHIFRNGDKVENVPLIGFVSASNELPAPNQGLEAIFDRFLVRIYERPIKDEDSFFNMVIGEGNMSIKVSNPLTLKDIEDIRKGAATVVLSEECKRIILTIRKKMVEINGEPNRDEKDKYIVSDRRWKKIVNLMRVSAFCNGRNETDEFDASLISNCIWSTELQEMEVTEIVADAIENYNQTNSLKKNTLIFEEGVKMSFFKELPFARKFPKKAIKYGYESEFYKCTVDEEPEKTYWILKQEDCYYISGYGSYSDYYNDDYSNYHSNRLTGVEFDEESMSFEYKQKVYKVLKETVELKDLSQIRILAQQKDEEKLLLIEKINKHKADINNQINYWRNANSTFVCDHFRQIMMNKLYHQNTISEELVPQIERVAGIYHGILIKAELREFHNFWFSAKKIAKQANEKILNEFNKSSKEDKDGRDCYECEDENGVKHYISLKSERSFGKVYHSFDGYPNCHLEYKSWDNSYYDNWNRKNYYIIMKTDWKKILEHIDNAMQIICFDELRSKIEDEKHDVLSNNLDERTKCILNRYLNIASVNIEKIATEFDAKKNYIVEIKNKRVSVRKKWIELEREKKSFLEKIEGKSARR